MKTPKILALFGLTASLTVLNAAETITFDADLEGFALAPDTPVTTTLDWSPEHGGSMKLTAAGGWSGNSVTINLATSVLWPELQLAVQNGGTLSFDLILTASEQTLTGDMAPNWFEAVVIGNSTTEESGGIGGWDGNVVNLGIGEAQWPLTPETQTLNVSIPIRTMPDLTPGDGKLWLDVVSPGWTELLLGLNNDGEAVGEAVAYIDNLTVESAPPTSDLTPTLNFNADLEGFALPAGAPASTSLAWSSEHGGSLQMTVAGGFAGSSASLNLANTDLWPELQKAHQHGGTLTFDVIVTGSDQTLTGDMIPNWFEAVVIGNSTDDTNGGNGGWDQNTISLGLGEAQWPLFPDTQTFKVSMPIHTTPDLMDDGQLWLDVVNPGWAELILGLNNDAEAVTEAVVYFDNISVNPFPPSISFDSDLEGFAAADDATSVLWSANHGGSLQITATGGWAGSAASLNLVESELWPELQLALVNGGTLTFDAIVTGSEQTLIGDLPPNWFEFVVIGNSLDAAGGGVGGWDQNVVGIGIGQDQWPLDPDTRSINVSMPIHTMPDITNDGKLWFDIVNGDFAELRFGLNNDGGETGNTEGNGVTEGVVYIDNISVRAFPPPTIEIPPMPQITEVDYQADSDTFRLTWSSLPGKTYSIFSSTDLSNWNFEITDDVPSGGDLTTYPAIGDPAEPNPFPASDRVFLRVGENPSAE